MTIKNVVCLSLCTAVLILTAGCGKNNSGTDDIPPLAITDAGMISETSDTPEASGISVVPEASESSEIPDITVVSEASEEPDMSGVSGSPESSAGTEGIDVDLTIMSSTMVYAEVFNMVYNPENYTGKTVKMKGIYAVYHDENQEKTYHACVISDATACCSQGIEFELTDEYQYPEDYPEESSDICVTGTFDTYMEDGYTYCILRDAQLLS
ncbi:MAG: hypothetical protein K5668_11955 [Lachnospiraceae bacterium]|nr:hypothetical protein [Lachnospiraceae bacterium]